MTRSASENFHRNSPQEFNKEPVKARSAGTIYTYIYNYIIIFYINIYTHTHIYNYT